MSAFLTSAKADEIARILKKSADEVIKIVTDDKGEANAHACIVAMLSYALVGWRFGRRVGLPINACVRLIKQTMADAEKGGTGGTVEKMIAAGASETIDRKVN